MKKQFIKNGLLSAIAVLGIAVAVPLVAQALPARAQDSQTNAQGGQQGTAQTTNDQGNSGEVAQKRLADAKLKACQNRERTMTNIMSRLGDRGQKQADLFGTIADRTQKYYTDKGLVLANYDELVANVTAKRTAAQETVRTVKATGTSFRCDGDDPKGVASTFKNNLSAEIDALAAYKTSVKDLIVGVKSAQSTVSAEDGGTN